MTEDIPRTACNVTCVHGGICTLPIDHDGLHSASGYCEWERTDGEYVESDGEAVTNTLGFIAGDPNAGRKAAERAGLTYEKWETS